MRFSVLFTLLFITNFALLAQPGWNWPEDPDEKSVALEKQAYYKVNMGLEEWETALKTLNWLYANNPELNPSIYIDGAKVIENLIEKEANDERISRLQDSLLWTYDMREEYFDDDAEVIDRKAYTAFKLFYKDPDKYPLLASFYGEAVDEAGSDLSTFNIAPYMTLAKYYYQRKPDEMSAQEVLDIHSILSDIINAKMEKNPDDAEKLRKEQDKIDALLSSMGDLINCDFIQDNLVPKLEKDPNDLNTAKKIFSYSLKAKCTDEEFFTKAGEVLYEEKPDFNLAFTLGKKYQSLENYSKSIEYFQKSLELTSITDKKYEALMGLAVSYFKTGNRPKARNLAYEAISIDQQKNEAYNLIGNLYFTSYQDCKKSESRVYDRLVFIAAYDMYRKAGNTKQMNASKEQFPSKEEIFNEGYEKGQQLNLGCWINKTVALDTRD
jgi:hypothetical protein